MSCRRANYSLFYIKCVIVLFLVTRSKNRYRLKLYRREKIELHRYYLNMSHEFELHHLVSELVSLLRVTDTADVDAQVDLLLKNRTPYITTQVSLTV